MTKIVIKITTISNDSNS